MEIAHRTVACDVLMSSTFVFLSLPLALLIFVGHTGSRLMSYLSHTFVILGRLRHILRPSHGFLRRCACQDCIAFPRMRPPEANLNNDRISHGAPVAPEEHSYSAHVAATCHSHGAQAVPEEHRLRARITPAWHSHGAQPPG